MLKILQARFQQQVNRELPDVQAGFRKGRGTRDQIANICWIIENSMWFTTIYFWTVWTALSNTLLIRNAFLTLCKNSYCQRKKDKK